MTVTPPLCPNCRHPGPWMLHATEAGNWPIVFPDATDDPTAYEFADFETTMTVENHAIICCDCGEELPVTNPAELAAYCAEHNPTKEGSP